MTSASSLPSPSSRTLAGWWKQMTTLAPRRWWFGDLCVHRVEAAVQVRQVTPLPPLTQAVLHTLSLAPSEESSREELEESLRFPGPLLHQCLRQLSLGGMLDSVPPNRWRLTEPGRRAIADRKSESTVFDRRLFSFVERRDANGARLAPPFFVPMEAAPQTGPSTANLEFDVAWLEECIGQDPAWKETQGFPTNVERLLKFETNNGSESLPAWQKVVVDRLEVLTLVLAQPSAEPDRIHGFVITPANWALDLKTPIFQRRIDATPYLHEESSAQACRDAWLAWAKLRNLPAQDVEACELSLEGVVLHVRGPRRLLDSLRQSKSDLVRGEAWVLLGDGFVRQAVRLDLTAG